MLDYLLTIDHYLFDWINQKGHSTIGDFIFPIWRDKRTWIPLYAVILGFFAWKYQWKTLYIVLLIGVTILVADQISSELLKKSIQRIRPCNDPMVAVNLLVACGKGFSFTSSHACNHFALAFIFFQLLKAFWKKQTFLAVLLFAWAGLIAYAQVYVGVHYPLDVIAGAILGITIAALIWQLWKRFNLQLKLE